MIKIIPRLLIVDDEKNMRDGLKKALNFNFHVEISDNALQALEMVKETDFDIILTDVKMPKMDGITFVKKVMAIKPQTICFVMTAYGSIEFAVEAMRVGAKDFITKPFDINDLEQRLQMSLKKTALPQQESFLKGVTFDPPIIGESVKLQETLNMVERVAPTKATVLLTGESGTGKEIFARAIHLLSTRAKKPFIAVHCQSFNENLIESELFGHEKGAFTNASNQHIGRFEAADGGTLFLDEIGDIDMNTQVKLLRILETRTFERLGGRQSIKTDVRLITATNRDLRAMVEEGTFREDLYYRLNVFNIHLPPLRQRQEDIPLLVEYFLQTSDFQAKNITPKALEVLREYPWRGNIRELKNVIEHASILCENQIIELESLPAFLITNILEKPSFNIDNNEQKLILEALKQAKNNKTKAAEILGINRRTLHRKIQQLKLDGE